MMMKDKITIPNLWDELSDYQQIELINLLHHTNNTDAVEQYIRIVQILLMKDNSTEQYFRMRKILRNIPISAFRESVKFLSEKPTIYHFPKIDGLIAPAPRLGDLTIEQFSLCDTLYYRYQQKKEKIYLRQLVATLYRLAMNDTGFALFDKRLLPQIANITDKISLKEAQRIAFVFFAVKMYISDAYPSLFKVKNEEENQSDRPIFRKKDTYTPFSQIITMMAADELRLLGNLNECKQTLLYDFLNAFLESKRIHKMKAEHYKL